MAHGGPVGETDGVHPPGVDSDGALDIVEQRSKVGEVVDALLAGLAADALPPVLASACIPGPGIEKRAGGAVGNDDREAFAVGEVEQALFARFVTSRAGHLVEGFLAATSPMERENHGKRG